MKILCASSDIDVGKPELDHNRPSDVVVDSEGSSMNPLSLSLARFGGVAIVVTSFSVTIAGQGQSAKTAAPPPASSSQSYTKRTPWGHPDLQGLWTNTTTTTLERPAELADKATLTSAERAEFDRKEAGFFDKVGPGSPYNDAWFERGVRTQQTSLIVDPPNGHCRQ